jgi:cyclopropane-fatty-acyl-phospholipid synthase
VKSAKIFPIDKFIENALYNNRHGYYSNKNPFGKSGDFITSPGISSLFSEMIAIWIISFWENLGKPKRFNIVELGPGDGELCKVLLKTFKKFPDFYKSTNVLLYERSEFLKNIQKNKIKEENVSWLNNLGKIKNGPTLFFGNEFFDAIPVKQFEKKNKKIYEKYLQLNKNSSLKIILKKASSKNIRELKKFKLLKKNGIVEYPKLGFKKLEMIVKKIKKFNGGLLLIDYGSLKNQNISTLQSVRLHKKNRIFDNIGSSDITSLVNFGLLKDYLAENKLTLNKVVSQSFFLKRIGILDRAEILSHKMTFRDKSNLYLRLQRLLSSKYMGDLFKVIFAYKSKKKFLLGFK